MSDLEDRCTIYPNWGLSQEKWLAQRLTGIGGSVAGAICGVNKYLSALQAYGELTGKIPHEQIDNEAIKWGNRFERPIAEEYAERENVAVVEWPVMLRNKERPWMLANMDFLIVEVSDQFPAGKVTTYESIVPPTGIIAILEIKTTGIGGHGTAHDWDNDRVPPSYEHQCRHYMATSGISDAWLVGLLGGRGLAIRRIPADSDFEEYLVAMESDFWNKHVVLGIPPAPDGSESAESAIKSLYPVSVEEKEIEGGATLELLWHDFQNAKEAAKKATDLEGELKNKIKLLLGDAAYGTVYGKRICSYRSSQDSEFFAEKKFAADNPKLYEQYRMSKPGFRSLRKSS